MTLAPPPDPDRWSYIRTIAEQRRPWLRLVRRAIRIFNRLKHKQGLIQRAPQINSALSSTSQVGNYLDFTGGLAVNAYTGAGDSKANVNQANQMAERWSHLEGYNGSLGISNGQYASAYSYCAGHSHPPSFKARFSRACRAFVNAWRAK